MQVRPTVMAAALLQAAVRKSAHETSQKVMRHCITDNPNKPLESGYNRTICDNIRVNQATLSNLYKE